MDRIRMKGFTKNFYAIGFLALSLLGILFFGTGEAFAHQSTLAYVPNAEDGTITVIDVGKNQLVKTIKVDQKLSHGIAVTPDGKRIFTGNYPGNEILVVDADSGQVIRRIDIGATSHGIDISPDGRFVYAGGRYEKGGKTGQVSVINAQTLEIVAQVSGAEGTASHMAFSPDGLFLYIASIPTDSVWVLDVRRNVIVDQIDVGKGPNEVAVSPDGKRVFSANILDSTVSVIDTETRKILATIPAGKGTHGIIVAPDGKTVWTANRKSEDLTVIDTETLNVIASIPIHGYANHLAFRRDGEFAYVTRKNDIAVVDVKRKKMVGLISTGKDPHEISLEDTLPSK